MNIRERVRMVLAFGLVGFILLHATVRTCWRGGCYRTFLGRWLVEQGDAAAALVRGVEGVVSVAAALAVVGYLVSRVRARLG